MNTQKGGNSQDVVLGIFRVTAVQRKTNPEMSSTWKEGREKRTGGRNR